jgi:hypothetical protein
LDREGQAVNGSFVPVILRQTLRFDQGGHGSSAFMNSL